MFLYELFPPELIKTNLEADDKDEVFEEMVDQFCQATKSNVRDDILASIHEREAKMSTGIQKGIAVPHGKSNALENIHGVLGISRKGIDYDALDGQPVYVLFMLLAPQKDSEKHLRLLKRLAGLLDNHEFITELQAQTNPQNAQRVIRKYEEIFISE